MHFGRRWAGAWFTTWGGILRLSICPGFHDFARDLPKAGTVSALQYFLFALAVWRGSWALVTFLNCRCLIASLVRLSWKGQEGSAGVVMLRLATARAGRPGCSGGPRWSGCSYRKRVGISGVRVLYLAHVGQSQVLDGRSANSGAVVPDACGALGAYDHSAFGGM